jgi:hypothetical protein
MKIDKDNYFKKIKAIDLDNAPKVLRESHKLIVLKTDHGKDWSEYDANKSLRKIFDLTFIKLGEYIDGNEKQIDGLDGTSTSEAIQAFTHGEAKRAGSVVSTGRELFYYGNLIAEWYNNRLRISNGNYDGPRGETGSKTTKSYLNQLPGVNITQRKKQWYLNGEKWNGEPIFINDREKPMINSELEESALLGEAKSAINFSNRVPEEIKFFKRYLRLDNEKISRGELLSFIDALQKAILEKRISKTSPYAKYILALQQQLVDKYNKGDRFIPIKIPKEGKEKLESFTQSEKLYPSIRLLKRYVNLQGKNLTRDRAQNLLSAIDRAFETKAVTKSDKYIHLLLEIKKELSQFLNKKQAELYPVKASLSGIEQPSEPVIKKSTDFVNEQFETIGFTGKWFDLMGDPSPGFTAMVFGRPKMGKSFLCIDWAGYLAQNFGKVLYVAKEEQFHHPLQIKLKEKNVAHDNLDLADSLPKDLSGYRFIFIDSVQGQGLTPEQLRDLKTMNPGVSFVYVFQVTKSGQFRGANEFQHDVDVVVEIPEKGKAVQYGRFNQGGEMEIFPKEEPQPEKDEEAIQEEPALMGIKKKAKSPARKKKKYDVLSPDGFSIRIGVEPFSSMNKAVEYFNEWKDRYKMQGYYSSVPYGRIPLEDLEDYCQWVEID